MRAISVQQPYVWAICRGGKRVENRRNKGGHARAKAQFNQPGPLLIHAGQRDAGVEAYRLVKNLSPVDPGMAGSPRSDTAWAYGAFIATVQLTSVHTADECYDPVTGRYCSPWAEPNAAHLVLDDVQVLHRPVPYAGQLGLWKVEDTTVLAQIQRQAS